MRRIRRLRLTVHEPVTLQRLQRLGEHLVAHPVDHRAAELGYARSTGVSNFDEAELASVAGVASLMPAVNQVNYNPFAYRRALHDACQRRNITLEAYSPLGTGATCRMPP